MLYFGHGTSTSLSPQLLGLHSLAVRTSHEATTQPVPLDFRKCLLATFMDVATRKFIRHLDLRAWPSGDIGGVDGEGGDEEGGESDAEEHDDKHGGTFHTLNDLRKPEIFVSGKIDISPTSQSGKLRPARSDSQPAQGLCLHSVPLALPPAQGPCAHSHLPLFCRVRGGRRGGEDSAPSSRRCAAWRSPCSSCSYSCCSSCSPLGRTAAAAPWSTTSPAPSGSCSATAARRPPDPRRPLSIPPPSPVLLRGLRRQVATGHVLY